MSEKRRTAQAVQQEKEAPKWKSSTQELLINQLESLTSRAGLNSKIKRTYLRA